MKTNPIGITRAATLIVSAAVLWSGTGIAEQPSRESEKPQLKNPREEVFVDEKIMHYEAALPILTQMLEGDAKEIAHAVGSLKYYGVSLKNTEALKKLVALLERKNDFSVFDEKFKAVRNGTYTGSKEPPGTAAEEAVADSHSSKG